MRRLHLDSTDQSSVTLTQKNSSMNFPSKRSLNSRLNTSRLIISLTEKEEFQNTKTILSSRSQSASSWRETQTCIIASLWLVNVQSNHEKRFHAWRKTWLGWKAQIRPLHKSQQIGTACVLLRLAQSTLKKLLLLGLWTTTLRSLLIKLQMGQLAKPL